MFQITSEILSYAYTSFKMLISLKGNFQNKWPVIVGDNVIICQLWYNKLLRKMQLNILK